jgi:hypothetical protein
MALKTRTFTPKRGSCCGDSIGIYSATELAPLIIQVIGDRVAA